MSAIVVLKFEAPKYKTVTDFKKKDGVKNRDDLRRPREWLNFQ